MKRLNKKGFTLVELLATIVILAVLMLVGAQAIGAVMRSSRANSLLSSLDTAVKQAQTSYAQDELNYLKYDDTNKLNSTGNVWDKLTYVLDYDTKQYTVNAGYYNKGGKEFIIAKVTAVEGSSFKSVRCSHGKIDTNTAISTTDASGTTVTTTNKLDQTEEYSTEGYYCSEDANGYVTIIRIKKLAD